MSKRSKKVQEKKEIEKEIEKVSEPSTAETKDKSSVLESAKSSSTEKDLSSFFLRGFSGKSEFVFQALILFLICILAFFTRLFSVVRYESVIHEFDPWFNFRSTKYLVKEGFYAFHNWFDDSAWYPLGRFVGGTVYPGLMWTAATLYHLLHFLNFPVVIRNVCVFTAPLFAAKTSISVYLLAKEVWNGSAGLFAAAFISIVPGYISRSVAGSYDNEAIAIFALVNTFWLWVRAVKTGSMLWAALSALGYFYMVAAWGGYIFIINIIPVHVIALILAGRYSHRLYVAYSVFYILGTLMSMNILFVGFQPVSSPEHLASMGVFIFLQLYNMFFYIKSSLSPEKFKIVVRSGITLFFIGLAFVILLAVTGQVPFLTGRLLSLLGSTSNIAIVKSVSEHQPSPWTTFFFDLHAVVFLVPVGLFFCFDQLTDANLFVVLYVLFASYFASIMVRLVLVLSPGACVLGGIGASVIFQTYMDVLTSKSKNVGWLWTSTPTEEKETKSSKATSARLPRVSKAIAAAIISALTILFGFFVIHCNWVTSSAYSSPSIVLQATQYDGSRVIFDDFREAYQWLAMNTAPDAKILSWWDYGYQISGMGNRTVIVDNNTRNNTHIATVGLVMASSEERAYPVIRMLDVDYLLVVFGGRIGYSSDDINKFLWMVRISGGVFPEVVESDYFNEYGQYRVDSTVSERMRNSLMYKMCYYRFGQLQTVYGKPFGYDRVRNCEIGHKDIQLTHIEEAFTSEHWMVRIYRVKKPETHPNFEERLKQAKLFM